MVRSVELSILVPYRATPSRAEAWGWLQRYWNVRLPEAEVVVGTDEGVPFSKSAAVNEAASRARGSVFAIFDADVVLSPETVRAGVAALAKAPWVIPITERYKLRRSTSAAVLRADPATYEVCRPTAPDFTKLEVGDGRPLTGENTAVQIMPRDAFYGVGGMDLRFRGWGSEEIGFMRALDTLWGKHIYLEGVGLDLWHEVIPGPRFSRGRTSWPTALWEGQDRPSFASDALEGRYHAANGRKHAMRALVREGLETSIPRVLHRIWLDEPVPARFERFWGSFGELHPGWDLRTWDDSHALDWMQNRAVFEQVSTHAGRSDVLRYELLARYGGVYVDTDVQPLLPFDPLLAEAGCFIAWQDDGNTDAWTYGEVDRLMCPTVMGSEPGHPAIQALLDALPEWVAAHPDATPDLQTGPVFVSKVWQGRSDVRVLPSATFYPVPAGHRPRPGTRYPRRGTYAVHHWAASWQR